MENVNMENVNAAKTNEINNDLVTRRNVILLLTSLGLGIIFDIFFYDKPFGISYPLFVGIFYSAVLWSLKDRVSYRVNFGWLLIVPIIALSLNYFIFSNPIFNFLDFVGIPFLVTAQLLLVTNNNRYSWFNAGFIGDIIGGVILRPLTGFFKPFSILSALIKRKSDTNRFNTALKVITGLVISVPLLLIVVLLLSSADLVFNEFMGRIPEFFNDIRISEILVQTILVVLITGGAFSFISSLSGSKSDKSDTLEQGASKLIKGIWDPITVITIFIAINTVYVFFTGIQFSYLFGGGEQVLPGQLTYSEYARRGFFELVAVTLINFSVLLSSMRFTKKGGKIVDSMLRILYSLLVACTLVMLFSAHFRMSLYEEAYGYTYLRMLTHAFMAFLFVLFLISLYKIWNDRISIVKPYIITALIAYMIVNYMNIDVIIARNNIDRYFKTGKIDVHYLTELSYDAIPEMVKLIGNEDSMVSQPVENYLFEKKEELSKSQPWQSFNISKYRAKKVLSKYQLSYKDMDNSAISY